jgi:hypothetical protein
MMIPNPVNFTHQREFSTLPSLLSQLQSEHQWSACWLAKDRILIQNGQTLCQLRPRKQGMQLKFVQGAPERFTQVAQQLQAALYV